MRYVLAILAVALSAVLSSAQTRPIVSESQCPDGICQPKQPSWQPPPAKSNVPKAFVDASVQIVVQQGGKQWMGSGTIFEVRDGIAYIVTCKHVCPSPSGTITVILPSGPRYSARWLAVDNVADLAVIYIKADGCPPPVRISPVPPSVNVIIYQVGYPLGKGPVQRVGKARGYSGVAGKAKVYNVQLQSQQGDSGSGIFTDSLVAVLWGGNDFGNAVCSGWEDVKRFTDQCLPRPGNPVQPGAPSPVDTPNENLAKSIRDLQGNHDKMLDAIKLIMARIADIESRPPVPGPMGPSGPIGDTGPAGANGNHGTDGKPGSDAPSQQSLVVGAGATGLLGVLLAIFAIYKKARPIIQIVKPIAEDIIARRNPTVIPGPSPPQVPEIQQQYQRVEVPSQMDEARREALTLFKRQFPKSDAPEIIEQWAKMIFEGKKPI